MVLTVTINPLLENVKIFSNTTDKENNQNFKEEFRAGGKGINVSRQLNFLGIKNLAYTITGGKTGKTFRSILTKENINFTFTSTKTNTRTADLLIDNSTNKIETTFGYNSEITIDEVELFKSKLEKMINNCSTVIFSGSSPSPIADEIFPYGIDLAHKLDKTSILDTYGNTLKLSLEKAPTIVHNNAEEIYKTFRTKLESEEDYINYLKDLYKKGVKISFLTNGANPTYASKFGF